MPYATYTREMLANFTGRPQASFPDAYLTASAFPQATLLFKIGTCIADPSALSTDEMQMVDFAILSMADAIHLAAPYQTILASPFSSESIGSYSYGKAVKAVQQGLPTGITWFDLAIEQLSQCSDLDGLPMSGGIEVFERTGGYFGPGHLGGNIQFLSPADVEASRTFGFDPSTGHYVSQVGG